LEEGGREGGCGGREDGGGDGEVAFACVRG
jgi:hypothetical protein